MSDKAASETKEKKGWFKRLFGRVPVTTYLPEEWQLDRRAKIQFLHIPECPEFVLWVCKEYRYHLMVLPMDLPIACSHKKDAKDWHRLNKEHHLLC